MASSFWFLVEYSYFDGDIAVYFLYCIRFYELEKGYLRSYMVLPHASNQISRTVSAGNTNMRPVCWPDSPSLAACWLEHGG